MRVMFVLFVLLGTQTIAHAYLGPGLGVGAIAAALGVIGSIVLALLAVLYYPIKRLIKKKRGGKNQKDEGKENGPERDPTED